MHDVDLREYKASLSSRKRNDIEAEISRINGRIGEIRSRTEAMRMDAEAVMLEDKKKQLAEVLQKYGKVNLSALTVEMIAMTFARLQGEESVIREDIRNLSYAENEHHLKKQLAIAGDVLREKEKRGGRINE